MSNIEELRDRTETQEELFDELKKLPPVTVRGSRYKFNPNPKRQISSITGAISLRVIKAAKIACSRSDDGTCDQHEVAAVLADAGIDLSLKRISAMLLNLASTNEHRRTASAIFIRVPKGEAGVADDVADVETNADESIKQMFDE